MGIEHKQSEITYSLKKRLQKVFSTIHPSLAIAEDEICPKVLILQMVGPAGNKNNWLLNVFVNLSLSNYIFVQK